jgi:3-phosphoshikimate 1-carboxyvinyltransferase
MKSIRIIKDAFNVSLNLPGSKSITLRDAILASLAIGESELRAPAQCDDYSRISEALIALGVSLRCENANSVFITGAGGHFRAGALTLQAGLSGAAARFLLALALLRCDETTIDGLPPLRARPNQYLVEALADLGASISSNGHGYLPVSVRGPEVCKASISVKGNRSSQYLSALLLVGHLL